MVRLFRNKPSTQISTNEVSDELYERVHKEFNEKDLVDLTMVIVSHQWMKPLGDKFPKRSWKL